MGNTFQPHIQRLYQAGIATHVVQNEDAVDPLFALAKVRDFPEVTFAAVFDDGAVILGCHDALPAQLATLAEPIQAENDQITDDLASKIEMLLAKTEAQQGQIALASEMASQINAIKDSLDSQVDQASIIQDHLAKLETRTMPETDSHAQDADAAALLDAISGLSADIKSQQDTEVISNIQSQIAALAENVTSLAEAHPELSAMLTRLDGRIDRILARATEDCDTLAQGQLGLKESLGEIAQVQTAIMQQLNEAKPQDSLALSDLTAQLGSLEELNEKLDEISTSLTSGNDTAVSADVTDTGTQVSLDNLAQNVDQLSNQIANLAKRPDPVIDMTEQRAGFARFQTALATVVGRLENEISRLATVEGKDDDATQMLEKLAEQINAITIPATSGDDLLDHIRSIDAKVAELPEKQDAIVASLTELGKRPEPILDMTEQKQTLAQFASSVGAAVKRLENVSMQLVGAEPDLGPILAKLDHVFSAAQTDDTNPELARTLATHTSEIKELRSEVASYLDRPAPTLDLTMQRASLARFATALGTVISRFERIAEQFENTDPFDPPAEPPAEKVSEEVSEELPAPTPFVFPDVSADIVRTRFAELIALQIMESATANAAQS